MGHGTVITYAHVLHGSGVIVGCCWLLDAHHGWLLSQDGCTLTSWVGGMIVASSEYV